VCDKLAQLEKVHVLSLREEASKGKARRRQLQVLRTSGALSEEEYAKEKRMLVAEMQVHVDGEREGRCGVMEEVVQLQVEMGDAMGAGRTLLRLADLHGTRYGNAPAQADAMQRALAEFSASGDEAGVSSVARGLAHVQLGQGHAEEARDGYASALLASGTGARAPEMSGQRLARHGMCQAMMFAGQMLSAEEGLLQLLQQTQDATQRATCLLDLGSVYLHAGRLTLAADYLKLAQAALHGLCNSYVHATASFHLARTLRLQGAGRSEFVPHLTQALQLMRRLLELAELDENKALERASHILLWSWAALEPPLNFQAHKIKAQAARLGCDFRSLFGAEGGGGKEERYLGEHDAMLRKTLLINAVRAWKVAMAEMLVRGGYKALTRLQGSGEEAQVP